MHGFRARGALVPVATLVYGLSVLPGVQAYCYFDRFGVEHCTLSTGVRIGIAIASIAAVLLLLFGLRSMRARSARRTNLAYIGTAPAGGVVSPGQVPPNYQPPGPNGYYYPQGYAPQYPPATYNGQSPYPSPAPPPGNLPQYAPPPGPPFAQEGYAAPPGPPPAQGGPPQYAPPPGPPPATEQKQ